MRRSVSYGLVAAVFAGLAAFAGCILNKNGLPCTADSDCKPGICDKGSCINTSGEGGGTSTSSGSTASAGGDGGGGGSTTSTGSVGGGGASSSSSSGSSGGGGAGGSTVSSSSSSSGAGGADAGPPCSTNGNVKFAGNNCYEFQMYRGGMFLPPPQASEQFGVCDNTVCSVNAIPNDQILIWNQTGKFNVQGAITGAQCKCSSFAAAPQEAQIVTELNTSPLPTVATDSGVAQDHHYSNATGCANAIVCILNF